MAEDKGLLGTIGSGIKNLLGSPAVQGLGLAAGFGFNPLIGLLAAPTLRNNRDVATLRNEQARSAVEGRKEFTDLLGQNVFTSSTTGTEVGRRTDTGIPVVSTPEGQNAAMAAISKFNPDFAARAMFTPQRRTSTDAKYEIGQKLFEQGMINREQFAEMMTGGGNNDTLESLRLEFDLMKMQQELAKGSDEASQRALEQTESARQKLEERQLLESKVQTQVGELAEMAALNADLAGGFQETGLPFTEARQAVGSTVGSIGQALGFDTADIKGDAAARARFNKLVKAVSFDALSTADLDRTTQQIIGEFFQQLPGDIPGPANDLVIADNLQGILTYADVKGIEIPGRQDIERLVEQLRQKGNAGIGADSEGEPEFIEVNGQIVPNPLFGRQ